MAHDHNDGITGKSGKQRRVSKKGIFLTAAIVAGIILASFLVYIIP
ncbi:MAG: hypothetical protein M3P08_13760 [Thermoproteota archaeon]|nr:hypothetical protein [Thermoproteota archaeon]